MARVVYRDRAEPGEGMSAAETFRAGGATIALATLVMTAVRAEQPEVPEGRQRVGGSGSALLVFGLPD
jgi:hypothetical protein